MTKSATKTAAVLSLALMMLIGANCFAVNPYFNATGSSGAFNSFALAAGPAQGGRHLRRIYLDQEKRSARRGQPRDWPPGNRECLDRVE